MDRIEREKQRCCRIESINQKNEDSSKKKEGRVEVREFLYADIYGDGMVERVKASDEAANAYYDEQDAEKFKEKVEENQ